MSAPRTFHRKRSARRALRASLGRIALLCCAFAFVACRAPLAQSNDARVSDTDRKAAWTLVTSHLREAMARRDLAAIERAVAEADILLGANAGVPETPDRYRPVPRGISPLTADEADAFVAPALKRMRASAWWRRNPKPAALAHPLREPAEVALAALAMREASPGNATQALSLATEAGEFLLRAQREAGTGGFPFPAARGLSDAAPFRAAQRALERAEREGRLDRVVRGGWLIDDAGEGGLQFDNGECGVAMLALHRATGDARYLAAARRAADWAIAQPLATNWNYNAFSVHLLAETYRTTGDVRYRDAAWDKARYGAIPGQLRDGPRAGRWRDPHNARPAYHYILLRGLVALAPQWPPESEERREIERALRLGLAVRNRDFAGPGAPNLDHATQTLQTLARIARDDPAMAGILKDTRSDEALAALRAIAAQAVRERRAPFAPYALGLWLADAASAAGSVDALR